MGLFEDPVARRELRAASRRWQTYLPRVLVGLALAWIAAYLWSESGKTYSWSYGPSRLADLSRETFYILFAVEMIFLPLLAASSASDLVTREMRQGTLGLLLLTPLSSWRIAFGKWKAAAAQTASLLILGAPLVAVCIYLGGVEAAWLPWSIALPLASAWFSAALALFCSTLFRTPSMVVVVSVILLVLGVVMPAMMSEGQRNSIEALGYVHPVFAALAQASGRRGTPDEGIWVSGSLSGLAGALLLVFLASRRLQGRLDVMAGPTLFSRLMGSLDAVFERLNAGRKSWFLGAEVWQSRALLWKELRLRAAGRFRYAARVGVALLLALILFSAFFGELRDSMSAFAWGISILVAIQALVTGVGLFTAEKEGRQWDVLLSTPLRAGEILRAKLLSGLVSLAPGAIVAGLYAVAVSATGSEPGLVWTSLALPVGLFTAFVYLASASASLHCATYRGAFGLAMGFVIGVLVGLPVILAFLKMFDVGDLDAEWWISAVSPVYHLGTFGDRLWRGPGWYYGYRPDDGATGIYAVLYLAFAAVLVVWMRINVERVARRA